MAEAKLNPTSSARGRLAFQLDKICKALDVRTEDLQNEVDVIELLHHTVSSFFTKSDNVEMLKNPPRILEHISSLTEEQIQLTNKINEAFYGVNYESSTEFTVNNG